MDMRQQRGFEIAQKSRIRKESKGWIVPSQSGNGNYLVKQDNDNFNCSCPDYELRRCKCKHIWSIEYTIKKAVDSYGNESLQKELKITYTQDWSAYNKAQTQEGELFLKLLADLCSGIENKHYVFGRPTLPIGDMVFSSALKVYSTFSLRRFVSDMKTAKEKGFIDNVCSYVTVSNYMRNSEMTEILLKLIETSSLPLKSVEQDFAIDSTGFSTSEFKRWYDFKYGKDLTQRIWLKAHINTGVKTNIVTSVSITSGSEHDSTQFEYLFTKTTKNFNVREQSGDKAYLSRENLELVNQHGAVPYIPFKENSNSKARGSPMWKKMYHYFEFKREEFLQHYHKRSNVESTFNMIKAKFGKHIRSKDRTAQINELLLKVLCHNIVVLIHESFELGIEAQFK